MLICMWSVCIIVMSGFWEGREVSTQLNCMRNLTGACKFSQMSHTITVHA